MTGIRHFARSITYDELTRGLEAARAKGAIYARTEPGGLQIWNYTNACVYDRMWDDFALIARGLIIDPAARRLVATPFPKFFNVGELGQPMLDEPFEVFEKLDGSLIILFHHAGKWRAATRGAFDSEQAIWAEQLLARTDLSALDTATTYLAEAIYPENRIIVAYEEEGLVLLSAYDGDGQELAFAELARIAEAVGWRTARRYSFASQADLVASAEQLPEQEEGYVIRYLSGLRQKLKSPAYCRIHALISRVTPLGIWELMRARDDLESIRRSIPEELWADFDAIASCLQGQLGALVAEIARVGASLSDLSDKEVGLKLGELPGEIAPYIFLYRKNPDLLSDPKAYERLLRKMRPVGNKLDGYIPSHALTQVIGED